MILRLGGVHSGELLGASPHDLGVGTRSESATPEDAGGGSRPRAAATQSEGFIDWDSIDEWKNDVQASLGDCKPDDPAQSKTQVDDAIDAKLRDSLEAPVARESLTIRLTHYAPPHRQMAHY